MDDFYDDNRSDTAGDLPLTFKTRVKAWLKFNLYTFPLIASVYIPYQYFIIGLAPIQLVKWGLTSWLMSAAFNVIYQPYVSWLHHRGIVK